MSVKFIDYYQTLGVDRGASPDDLQRAYRQLTRKHHPDLNKDDPKAEERFRRINEAYEVLKDPEKRRRYDQLGSNWKQGQDFTPPPGAAGSTFDFRHAGTHSGFTANGVSDFFEAFFGAGGLGEHLGDRLRHTARAHDGDDRPRQPHHRRDARPQDVELDIDLEELYHGGTKHVELQYTEPNRQGLLEPRTVKLDVRIPPGALDGTKVRIKGEGPIVGHARSDLHLVLRLRPHPRFTPQGHDLITPLPISPWEAALGARVSLHTLEGLVTVSVPPGSQHGQKLRLRDKGLPKRDDGRGDLLAELRVAIPRGLSPEERELWERLRDASRFDPRAQGG
jgi:curved DNA-binding protein